MKNTPTPDLIDQLTLDEKLRMLGGTPHNLPDRQHDLFGAERVGLPGLRFADGPVGVHWWTKASTCYPALICLAATFDEETALLYGRSVGTDCRAFGVHVLLAPGVNIYRSPLCGRNFEYMGEDPELSGKLGAAYIRGVQEQGVSATIKHFTANNQEYDRHGISSDIDERTLREVYLRPFELAVKEGKTGCVMTSYNLVNGTHASEHKELITDILRDEWGFEGIVMSDWTSVYSTAQTINAGLDLEMPRADFLTPEKIKPLLETGVVSMETVNQRIRNRLKLMERFGWLNPDHKQQNENLPARNPETEEAALEVARRGIVLLKNDEDFLPRRPGRVKKIAVLGHHANTAVLCGGGSAYTPPHESITLADAIRRLYGDSAEVVCYPCVHPWRGSETFENSVFFCEDGTPGLTACYYNNHDFGGSPVSVRNEKGVNYVMNRDPLDPLVNKDFFSTAWSGQIEAAEETSYDFYMYAESGLISAELDGELLFDAMINSRRISRTLTAGRHSLKVCFSQTNKAHVHARFGYEKTANAYDRMNEALKAACAADLVVVGTGYVSDIESEGRDRFFELDERLNQLVLDAATANPNTVVALYAGGACDVSPWIDRVKSLLCLWYPGQNGTLAAAEILAGQITPSGKLPFTWEMRLEDRGSFPFYQDENGDRRVTYGDGIFTGYRHFDQHGIRPRYPFGYGLSYTSFAYENLKLTKNGSELSVEFDLTNTGTVAGSETALVFVSDTEASVKRPPKEFKAARRVTLAPGERTTVKLSLPARAFAFWDIQNGDWRVEPGEFIVSVGSDTLCQSLRQSVDVHLSASCF
jgi:beta-glucosidase